MLIWPLSSQAVELLSIFVPIGQIQYVSNIRVPHIDADEKIFTSMDVKPISGERARLLNRPEDAKVRAELEQLAHDVWNRIGIETLVRLDIRADENGKLHVLEANPKPDLKAPSANVTSLVAMGLPEFGMSYDDLILSVFADRMDMLLSQRRGKADRLMRLI